MNKINFLGCGRVGKTLAKIISEKNLGNVVGITTSSSLSAKEATDFIGINKAYEFEKLPPAEIYFIVTPDDLIQETVLKLCNSNLLKSGDIVLHCSGSLSSDDLAIVKNKNCFVASVHPIKSFASPSEAITTFNGTYCGIEGDNEALIKLIPLFENMGALLFPIKKEFKKTYHASSVLANNYLVTLHYLAVEGFKISGIKDDQAKAITSKLMQDAFNNINTLSHYQALTGPIQRGDLKTVTQHLKALQAISNKIFAETYVALGKTTLHLTEHSQEIKSKFDKIFENNS